MHTKNFDVPIALYFNKNFHIYTIGNICYFIRAPSSSDAEKYYYSFQFEKIWKTLKFVKTYFYVTPCKSESTMDAFGSQGNCNIWHARACLSKFSTFISSSLKYSPVDFYVEVSVRAGKVERRAER